VEPLAGAHGTLPWVLRNPGWKPLPYIRDIYERCGCSRRSFGSVQSVCRIEPHWFSRVGTLYRVHQTSVQQQMALLQRRQVRPHNFLVFSDDFIVRHIVRISHSYVFWVEWFIVMFLYVLFYLGQFSHFRSCFGAGVTNLNEPLPVFLLPPHYWGLGVVSIPLRAIVNKNNARLGVIYVAGDPLPNRRCTRLPGCFHFPKRKLNYNF